MNTIFVVGQHGNEKSPLKVLEAFGGLEIVVGNPPALEKNVRYIEADMNRSFPGKVDGALEEKLAFHLLPVLQKYEAVVDFHTATCETPIFIITTELNRAHIQLARRLGVKRVVYMGKSIASGRALIDHVSCGVSVESGKEGLETTEKEIERTVHFYLSEKLRNDLEIYEVFDFLKMEFEGETLDPNIKQFEIVRKGQIVCMLNDRARKAPCDFYPVLAREKSYRYIHCLMAKKLSLNSYLD